MNDPVLMGSTGETWPWVRRLARVPIPVLAVAIAILWMVSPVVAADPPVVRAGSELDFRPYCFTDKDGQPSGFGVELLKAVAEKMGLQLQTTAGPWDKVWNELVARQLDVLPVVARTPGREPLVDFSLPHTETFDAFFVREGRPPLKDLAAAAGKEIIVLRSDAAHHQLVERSFSGKVIPVESIAVGLRLIAAGRHDALLCSKLIGVLEREQAGIKGVESGPLIPDYKRTFSFAVRKGNTELLEQLNQGLRIVQADGTYDRLYRKWLGLEKAPPPKWQEYFWPVLAGIALLALLVVAWRISREAAKWDDRLLRVLAPQRLAALPAFWRYALAVTIVVVVMGLRMALLPCLGTVGPYSFALAATVGATVLLGTGPGLLTTVLGAIAFEVFVPGSGPVLFQVSILARLGVSLIIGMFVVFILHAARVGVVKARELFETAAQQNAVLEGINRVFRDALTCNTEEELGRACLKVAEEVTGSKFGFIGEINPETGRLDDIAISDPGWEACRMQDQAGHGKPVPTDFKIHGIYGRVLLGGQGFFTNDPASHPDRIGAPEGHPPLRAFLGVPLVREGKTIGMVAVGNREDGYRESDLKALEALAGPIVQVFGQKRAEEALQRSELFYRQTLESIPGMVFTTRPDGYCDYQSQQWVDYTGIPMSQHLGDGWNKLLHPEDRPRAFAAWRAAVEGRAPYDLEYRVRRHDGVYEWFKVISRPIRDAAGEIVRWFGVALNIEALKQAEEELRLALGRLQTFFDQRIGGIGIVIATARGNIIQANDYYLSILGCTREELQSDQVDWRQMTPPEWLRADELALAQLRERGVCDTYEKEYERRDGTRVPVLITDAMMPGDSGEILAFVLDITERKRAEEALRASEEKYRNLFENMAEEVHFWQVVRDETGDIKTWRLVDANPSALKSWGRRTVEEIRGKTTDEVFGPGATEHYLSMVRQFMTKGTPYSFEDYFPNLDKYSRLTSVPLGEYFITTGADITAIRKAREAIEASLREKEVMLKEIHHRVKNNLQVIASLVDLQAGGLKEPGLLEKFADVRDRVRSMALVHEKLYQSESLARVDFADYMQSLLSYLSRSHGKPGSTIVLKNDLQPVLLSVEKAVPCGLMVNELVSNAYKHAFRGRERGEISTALRADPDGRVSLRVEDNGVGLPAGLDWRQSRSLGLRLIQLLSGQLHATVEVRSEGGTEFEITFEAEKRDA